VGDVLKIWVCLLFTLLATTWILPCKSTSAWQVYEDATIERLLERIDAQNAELQSLRERFEAWDAEQGDSAGSNVTPVGDEASCTPTLVERLPLIMEQPLDTDCDASFSEAGHRKLNYFVDYDKAIVLRPFDRSKHPYELAINGWVQLRHHTFSRNVETWTDSAGVVRPVEPRNAFEIERGRLVLSGFAADPRLTYFLQLDGDTDGAHAVDFFDYWWAWQVSDSFRIQFGKRKVTAVRQWILGARDTRLVDRPLANDFFRPGRTVGIFGTGSIGKAVHYEIMAGNGYNGGNIPESQSDTRFVFSATGYMDPFGDFGGPLADLESTDQLLLRLGHSFAYSPQEGSELGNPRGEADFLWLADGTRLTDTGVLGPGLTASDFDLYLYGLDAAFKYRGWSANGEAFFRWIESIKGDGPVSDPGIFQHGWYLEGGKFLIPKRLDINARFSTTHDPFGTSNEYAAGLNLYPLANRSAKLSFDTTMLDGSSLNNPASDIRAGDDGLLFRTQFQAEF
jgi:hypothetical protein